MNTVEEDVDEMSTRLMDGLVASGDGAWFGLYRHADAMPYFTRMLPTVPADDLMTVLTTFDRADVEKILPKGAANGFMFVVDAYSVHEKHRPIPNRIREDPRRRKIQATLRTDKWGTTRQIVRHDDGRVEKTTVPADKMTDNAMFQVLTTWRDAVWPSAASIFEK